MIERQEAEIFLALAEELHFGRTAERLRLSTSRVSQTVRGIERRVGAPLFHRTSRHVELTLLGRQLEAELRPAWEQVEGVWRRAVAGARGLTGSLRVAFVGPAAGQLVARAAQRFADAAPDCEVSLVEWPSYDVASRLAADDADLALSVVSAHGDPRIRVGPVLVREAWVLALPVGHPFARRETLDPVDLSRVDVLEVDGLPRVDRPEDVAGPSAPTPSAATLTEGLTQVGAGLGALAVGASVPRYHPRPDVAYVPLAVGARLEWALAWHADRTTARTHLFAETAQETVGQ